MQKKNIVLSTTEPITDGGRKYNFLYFIGAIAGFIFGLCLSNFSGGILFAVIGMLLAWGIKNLICDHMTNILRQMTFNYSRKIPYDQLIQGLQPYLLPLNMTIERGKDGNPIISYNGLIYDVTYNEDDTFSIWWRQSLVKAFITSNEYISVYRKASVAYGIIAYDIQQICSAEFTDCQNKTIYSNVASKTEESVICPKCGAVSKTDAKFCIECGTALEKTEDGIKSAYPKYEDTIEFEDKYFIKCETNSAGNKTIINNTPIRLHLIDAMGNGNEKKKIGFRFLTKFFAIIVIGLIAFVFISSAKKNKYINYVKEGCPEMYPNITYGQAFDDFFDNPKWKYFESDKGMDVVEFTGGCFYADAKVTVTIQFALDVDKGTFTVEYFDMNDVPQNEFMIMAIIYNVFESYGAAEIDHVIKEDVGKSVTEADNLLVEENSEDYDVVLEQQITEENDSNIKESELYSTENTENEIINYSLWEDIYQRSIGPSATIFIISIDDKGIVFTAGIGASGYTAYVDMREFYAKWTEEYIALYEAGSGYALYFVLNEDGSINISENAPYYGGLGLTGFYTKESDAVFPDCEFVFPQSADRYIADEECEGLSELECKIARNEIYARHGRKFTDASLQGYFDVCLWYNGTIESEDFSAEVLNDCELENLRIIGEYETKMGYK